MTKQHLNALLLTFAICLLTACGGGGNSTRNDQVDHALNYLPDDALLVMSGNVERVVNSAMFKKLQAEIPDFDEGLAEMKENVGLSIDEVARVTVAMISPKEGDVIAVVQTKRDVSIEDVKKIKEFKGMEFPVSKVGSADVYAAGPSPFSIHFPDARTVVVGPTTAMNKMLSRAEPAPTANMKAALDMARFDKALTIVTSVKGLPQEVKNEMMNEAPGEAAPILNMLIAADSMSLHADVTDVLDVAIEADFPEVANAESLNNMVQGLKAMALAGGDEDMPAGVKDMVNQIQSEADGSTFRVSAKIDLASVLAPLAAARGTARGMQSATQIRGLHIACVLWSNSNNGKFPDSIGPLVLDDYYTPDYAISPFSSTTVPGDWDSWEDQKKVDWINANTSYFYIPGHTDDNDSQKIILFERVLDSERTEIPVVFNDNHVEVLSIDEASAKIEAQTGKSLEALSKLSNPGAGGK